MGYALGGALIGAAPILEIIWYVPPWTERPLHISQPAYESDYTVLKVCTLCEVTKVASYIQSVTFIAHTRVQSSNIFI